jgi:hypothetical protein
MANVNLLAPVLVSSDSVLCLRNSAPDIDASHGPSLH